MKLMLGEVGIPGCPFAHLSTDLSFSGFVIGTLMFSGASSNPGGNRRDLSFKMKYNTPLYL